ncbi:MAG: 3-deoxy-7-phosphoheptulonate synthase [Planctomycetes bacterium]|nr:3-deoxy-7-phosphoheptulonate synthase [Planctomycetota bacterium]
MTRHGDLPWPSNTHEATPPTPTLERHGFLDDLLDGPRDFLLIAGPCAVESEEQTLETARRVQAAGAHMLRGGAFKPRTQPTSFQGLGVVGLDILAKARADTGLPIVTEVMDVRDLERVATTADVLQVGSRNMQNFTLLRELGLVRKPILLKRGMSATLEEWLGALEYVLRGGNERVILCERGIRTFENATRNTLDLSIVPLAQRATGLPVIVDPSHATGRADLILSMSLAAIAAGADGLIVEVHPDPENALSDREQQIDFDAFHELAQATRSLARSLHQGVAP